jgi:hypothetical protein
MREFVCERHLFLIAANKLVEHIDWASSLGFLDTDVFLEMNVFSAEIKSLRDMNEHVVEYFMGGGRRRQHWVHVDEAAVADASSTVGSKIGGRLDWNEVAKAAETLIAALPAHYFPARNRLPLARS